MQQLTELLQQKSTAILQSKQYKEKLEALINELILHDFAAIVHILYKIDVPEKELKEALKNNPDANAAAIMADKIIKRQVAKEAIRQVYKPNENIPDEEKW